MNDIDIREELVVWLDACHEKLRIFDELQIGGARADVVALTDRLTGYEIKGDADSYARLPNQIKEYDRYFHQNFLVVGKSHMKSAAEHIPPYWGLICVHDADNGVRVELMRSAGDSPKFSIVKQLSLLWRGELASILKRYHLPAYRGRGKQYIINHLCNMPPASLRAHICEELFERDYTRFRLT